VLGFCFLSRRLDSHASMQAGMHAPQYSVHTTSSSSYIMKNFRLQKNNQERAHPR
jgi:hypothetical protein